MCGFILTLKNSGYDIYNIKIFGLVLQVRKIHTTLCDIKDGNWVEWGGQHHLIFSVMGKSGAVVKKSFMKTTEIVVSSRQIELVLILVLEIIYVNISSLD